MILVLAGGVRIVLMAQIEMCGKCQSRESNGNV